MPGGDESAIKGAAVRIKGRDYTKNQLRTKKKFRKKTARQKCAGQLPSSGAADTIARIIEEQEIRVELFGCSFVDYFYRVTRVFNL
ncbi:hypothetical protein AGMMS49959_12700 [Planctomycetales bacterium]|nr:hypothetical protein AGMMS49959_12700 [Planctomycetales bacterium]